VKPIEQLWECSDADEWDKALKRYWTFVKPQNLKLEQAFDALELQRVRQLDPRGWYDFLDDEYFRWKYTSPNRLATTRARLRWYIENDRLADLDRIRRDLLILDTDEIHSALALTLQIRGLGPAGASGLLAVIYPAKFGTADQFVVKALQQVTSLPEAPAFARMEPGSLRDKDAVLIIEVLRRKAAANNRLFNSTAWTPRKVDMVLWACRPAVSP